MGACTGKPQELFRMGSFPAYYIRVSHTVPDLLGTMVAKCPRPGPHPLLLTQSKENM